MLMNSITSNYFPSVNVRKYYCSLAFLEMEWILKCSNIVKHFSDSVSQLLAMLLKKKRSLLNSHILHLTFSLVGTVDSGHETAIIPNSTAFQDLLCDFEVKAWRGLYSYFLKPEILIRQLELS